MNGPGELINSGINVVDLFFYDSKRKKLFVRQLGKQDRSGVFREMGSARTAGFLGVRIGRGAFDPGEDCLLRRFRCRHLGTQFKSRRLKDKEKRRGRRPGQKYISGQYEP
jgi:hypothetical protein